MMQVQVALGNMPINLLCLSNGTVAFVRTSEFKTLFDQADVSACFYEEGFTIGEELYNYNTAYDYKLIPEMLEWLIAQKLTEPTLQHI